MEMENLSKDEVDKNNLIQEGMSKMGRLGKGINIQMNVWI